jgi:hypothetical protein
MAAMPHMKPARRKKKPRTRTIGWREYVGLPELGIPMIKAKIDTGARTSALQAEKIHLIEGDVPRVAFTVRYTNHGARLVHCVAPLVERREIRNTSGSVEERFVIKTLVRIGYRRWHIEVSLAHREKMGFDLILGRTALRGHRFTVNPARSFLAREPQCKKPAGRKAGAEVTR